MRDAAVRTLDCLLPVGAHAAELAAALSVQQRHEVGVRWPARGGQGAVSGSLEARPHHQSLAYPHNRTPVTNELARMRLEWCQGKNN